MVFRTLIFLVLLTLSGFVAAAQIDINSASAEDIAKSLTGIGPSKASAIVKYREANGPYEKISDLIQVKGVGKKTLDANRDKIRFASDN
jgi:competence protein ComEA